MYNRKKIFSGVALIATILVILISTIPPAQAQPKFVVASWDPYDEYGQGISSWYIYSNHTGAWVAIESTGYLDDDPSPVPWNVSQAMKIRIWVSLNKTLVGVSSLDDGENYFRVKITITNSLDAEVFTQQNMTVYQTTSNDDLYWYQPEIIPDFLPLSGEEYTISFLYEVYY